MRIKKIVLENMRSFVREEIVFPEGILLLAGDIGAGKSTILLAIDFALFGVQRGELNGGALLRNGKNQGSVELTFLLDGKEVMIKRVLKRAATGIVQDFGYLSVDGKGQEVTTVELKQRVIELLHYPQEMLTKKSLIYRYTVYTPQEEMKAILLGGKEERLETLRKVFNIEKYKKIVENAKVLTAHVKEKKKEYAGKVYDYDEKKKRLLAIQGVLAQVTETMRLLAQKKQDSDEKILAKRAQVQQCEEQLKNMQVLQHQLQLLDMTLEHKNRKLVELRKNMLDAAESIADVLDSMKAKQGLPMKTEVRSVEEVTRNTEQNLKGIVQRIQEARTIKAQSQQLREKVQQLDVCPTCKQKVTEVHKQEMHAREEATMQGLQSKLILLLDEEMRTEEQLQKLRQELNTLREAEKQAAVFAAQEKQVEKQKQLQAQWVFEQVTIAREVQDATKQRDNLRVQINVLEPLKKQRDETLKEFELLQSQGKQFELQQSALQQQQRDATQEHALVQREVREKELLFEKMEKAERLRDWIEESFVVLMQDIERNVLLRVHHELDDLFRVWFQKLIDNENMHVRLDEEFTPLIEQNGYDTGYENLSGGEKTAAALAYRLALNQVINNLVTTLNTRDMIILDEPTDGFSNQQIEKMRELLRELNMQQIILVSHEQQMENFVDQVIRLVKEEHVSRVVV